MGAGLDAGTTGWTRVPEATVDAAHAGWVAQERWIIDGWGSWEIMGERFEEADTIIFVDLPLCQHYWWASKRQVQCLFRPRIDGPEGCPMLLMTWQLFRMIWQVHHTARLPLLHVLASVETRKKVVRIGSAGEMRRFLRKYGS